MHKKMFFITFSILAVIIIFTIIFLWKYDYFFPSLYFSQSDNTHIDYDVTNVYNESKLFEFADRPAELNTERGSKSLSVLISTDKNTYKSIEAVPLEIQFKNLTNQFSIFFTNFDPGTRLKIVIRNKLSDSPSSWIGPVYERKIIDEIPDFVLLPPQQSYVMRIHDLRAFYQLYRGPQDITVEYERSDMSGESYFQKLQEKYKEGWEYKIEEREKVLKEAEMIDKLHNLEWKGEVISNTIQIKVE